MARRNLQVRVSFSPESSRLVRSRRWQFFHGTLLRRALHPISYPMMPICCGS